MKQANNLPYGIEVYSGVISIAEAELLIDNVESAINSSNKCNVHWGTPTLHSPDVTCLRKNLAINLSEHAFKNTECNCRIKEIEASLGKIMLKCLDKYINKYSIGLTQDEGFVLVKRGDNHTTETGIDDNPFVNRMLSMHFPLNVDKVIEYIKFNNIDYSMSLSLPSVVLFPSNFLFAYSKPVNDGLYEIENFFNDNPSQEYFEQVFSERSDQS